VSGLARAALFVFWSLVLWGTVWDASVLWRLVTLGWSAAADVVVGAPSGEAAFAWANRGCGLLAVFVWIALPLAQWSSSRRTA
jgi:hypothetical protein